MYLSFSKIHAALGLDKPLAIEAFGSVSTGAAPIAPSTLSLLKGIGVVPLELYGCSETTGPTAANTRSTYLGVPYLMGTILAHASLHRLHQTNNGRKEFCWDEVQVAQPGREWRRRGRHLWKKCLHGIYLGGEKDQRSPHRRRRVLDEVRRYWEVRWFLKLKLPGNRAFGQFHSAASKRITVQ